MTIEMKTTIRKINDSWYMLIPDDLRSDSQYPFDLEHGEEYQIRIDGKKLIVAK